MLLRVLVVSAAIIACTFGDEHESVDSNWDSSSQEHSDEWISAVFGDDCPECTEPIDDETLIIEEEPQYEVPVEALPEPEIVETTHEHHPDNRPSRQSSLRICRHLVNALEELEASHPQIRVLKKELKHKLHKHLSHLVEDLKKHKGDSVCMILDFVIGLARSLKANCRHKGTTPAPHTEKPVPEYPGYPQPQPEYPVPDYEPQPEYPEPHPVYPEHSTPDYEPHPVYPEHSTPDYEPHPEHKPEYPVPDYVPQPQEPIEYPEEHVHEVVEDIELGSHISPPFVGSLRGIPGEHYPNYTEVPITSFSCADKKYIPGFYADLETGCQVFHVCYEHRRESFLCPLGTIFNQPILACDYWYSSNCSQAPLYYDVNAQTEPEEPKEEVVSTIGALITTVIEGEVPALPPQLPEIDDLSSIVKFLPVKAKVTIFSKPVGVVASKSVNKIVSAASFPVVQPLFLKHKLKPLPLAKAAVAKSKFVKAAVVVKAVAGATVPVAKIAVKAAAVPVVKAKFVKAAAVPVVKAAAVPIVKAKFVKAAAVPVVKAKFVKAASLPVKAKFIKVAAAVPVAKAKLAVVPVAAAKVVAAKAVPVVKAKLMGAVAAKAVPIAKGKLFAVPAVAAAKAVPAFKFAAAKAIPIGKFAATAAMKPKLAAASVAIPLVKAKFAAAAISPLTKKALALGYMKLLKAKKIAIMG